ncbi:MAG: hypothetical protein KDI03_14170 [Anaerolineae bacterium]|nr:hypothetical protein [Anaerolineae bacterium]
MTLTTFSDRLISVIDDLEPGGSLEAKVSQLAESEIRRRLARYQLVDRRMRTKDASTNNFLVLARSGDRPKQ